MIYTSRSRIETFLDCPRKGYINFLWDGRGLVKRGCSVYLSTGTYTHIGLEILFKAILAGRSIDQGYVDLAVGVSLDKYRAEIRARGFDLEEGENRENESYVVDEQCALVEAFIRAFAVRVLPDLLNRFRIVDVEREEHTSKGGIILEGRIDVIVEEIGTGDIYIFSFKTAASWDRRQEKANEHDNQGLSETFLLENRLGHNNSVINNLSDNLNFIMPLKLDDVEEGTKLVAATNKYLEYIKRFRKKDKTMGVIMIYMLKGRRDENEQIKGRWEQHSPLIRPYRKLVGTMYEYAPSLWFDNPANKSGKGRLGKGWESFNVWEDEELGGVKGWIGKLVNNELGNVGDVIGRSFKVPGAYFRNQEHIDSWFRQTIAIEKDIKDKLGMVGSDDLMVTLDYLFPQRKKGCHYPTDCQYLDVCYNSEIFSDPVGSGKFIYRIPHHELERGEHERLYNISTTAMVTVGEKENTRGDNRGVVQAETRIQDNDGNKGTGKGGFQEIEKGMEERGEESGSEGEEDVIIDA